MLNSRTLMTVIIILVSVCLAYLTIIPFFVILNASQGFALGNFLDNPLFFWSIAFSQLIKINPPYDAIIISNVSLGLLTFLVFSIFSLIYGKVLNTKMKKKYFPSDIPSRRTAINEGWRIQQGVKSKCILDQQRIEK